MNRIIKLAVLRPGICITLLIVVTVFFAFGIKNLRMESSTEALMPQQVEEYRYNMRMKKVFGDSKLYMICLIEARDGNLFSYENFAGLDDLVEEIEEFHQFDYETEKERLDTLIRLGSANFVENESTVSVSPTSEAAEYSDEEIDALLTGKSGNFEIPKQEYFDPFAIGEPIPEDMFVNFIRVRRIYSLEHYTPVSYGELADSLDESGRRQLETVLSRLKLDGVSKDHILEKDEFSGILEEFESVYLYKSTEAVKGFMNPLSGEDIVGTADSLIPIDLVEADDSGKRLLPRSEADFEAYTERLLASPSFEDTLYSRDGNGHITALAMNIQLQLMEEPDYIRNYLMDVFNKHNRGRLEFTPVGLPVFEYFIQSYMKQDISKFMPLVILVVMMTFLLNFRSARGIFLPTLSILLSILWTMGLMGHLKIPLTMVVNVLPTILVAVGSSYSIHIYNQYLHDLNMIMHVGKKKGLIASMIQISATVSLAALTTFLGFSTLGFNQVISLKHFGIFSAVGTLFTMLIASLLIPAVLSLSAFPRKKISDTGKTDFLQNLLVSTGKFALGKPVAIITVSAVILLISAIGVSKLNIESAPTYSFKENSYVVQADKKVSQALKGTLPISLAIDTGREGGVKDPEFLKKLDELALWTVSEENRKDFNLLKSFTFCDIIKRMNKAINEEDPASYVIPDDAATIADYLMLYSGEDRNSDGLPDSMERFTDPRYRVANLFIKTGYYDGSPYSTTVLLKAIDALETHLAEDPYFSSLRSQVTGQTLNYAVLNSLIARGQVITIILTLLIISVIIFILFRNIKVALVSLIPISCSILVVFGIMGFFKIPLDITKSIIAAVTIGIGIDDTIHMLKTIRFYQMEGLELREAIMASYREAGKAIVYTSVALVCGFAVLMFSQFKVLFYLGLLVAMNMITTTIAALIVLPAALWLLKIRFKKKADIPLKKQAIRA